VRTLIMDPRVMLFDEPTSALDPELTGAALRVILDLALGGRTAIIVTRGAAGAGAGRAPREKRTRGFIGRVSH
jgi:ABC-type histidine transport system ATPase subunit